MKKTISTLLDTCIIITKLNHDEAICKKLWWTNWMDLFFDWRCWLMKKYNIIWDKVSADIKNKVDWERVCKKTFLKTKTKSYGDEVTDFYDKVIHKINSNHTCLAVLSLDSALNKDGNYYPQVFLKECKYIKKKMIRQINEDMERFSSNSDEE